MKKQVLIFRGLPGAGKSRLVSQISAQAGDRVVVKVSADDYFDLPEGYELLTEKLLKSI